MIQIGQKYISNGVVCTVTRVGVKGVSIKYSYFNPSYDRVVDRKGVISMQRFIDTFKLVEQC